MDSLGNNAVGFCTSDCTDRLRHTVKFLRVQVLELQLWITGSQAPYTLLPSSISRNLEKRCVRPLCTACSQKRVFPGLIDCRIRTQAWKALGTLHADHSLVFNIPMVAPPSLPAGPPHGYAGSKPAASLELKHSLAAPPDEVFVSEGSC